MTLAQVKAKAATKDRDLCDRFLAIILETEEFVKFVNDNGFQTGGANAIVGSDLDSAEPHLTAAIFNATLAAMTAAANALDATHRSNLRKARGNP